MLKRPQKKPNQIVVNKAIPRKDLEGSQRLKSRDRQKNQESLEFGVLRDTLLDRLPSLAMSETHSKESVLPSVYLDVCINYQR